MYRRSKVDSDDDDVLAHLLQRAESIGDARESRLLRDLTVRLRAAAAGGPMVLRCAWCGRFEVDEAWVALGAEQVKLGKLADVVTHGLCADCFGRLAASRG